MGIKFYERPTYLGPNPYLTNDTPVLGEAAQQQTGDSTDPKVTGKHYQYEYKGTVLDPYHILAMYGVYHPAIQHAIKKLLRRGSDGEATIHQEVRESISSLKCVFFMSVACLPASHVIPGSPVSLPRIFRVYKINDYCIAKALEELLILNRGLDDSATEAVESAIYHLEEFLKMEEEDESA